MHYALHHTKLPAYLTEMKKYHLAHHYKSEFLYRYTTDKRLRAGLWRHLENLGLRVQHGASHDNKVMDLKRHDCVISRVIIFRDALALCTLIMSYTVL